VVAWRAKLPGQVPQARSQTLYRGEARPKAAPNLPVPVPGRPMRRPICTPI
jgi:hypothetical protein